MLKENCVIKFDPVNFIECDPCRHYYFSRTETIKLTNGVLVVKLNYDFKTCFEGLGKGDYLNTITLLPAEELGLEVVRRHKYTRDIREQTSMESEIENTFTETTRDTFNVTGEYKFSVNGEANFKIFGIGVKASTELSVQTKLFYERFKEIVESTRHLVSRKYDFAMEVRTELENTLTSTRKIKNPNNCHPVHYLVSQLMKKYKSELILINVEFDFQPKIPIELSKKESSIKIFRPIQIPYNFFISKVKTTSSDIKSKKESNKNYELIKMQPRISRELRKNELLKLISNIDTKSIVKGEIEKIEKRPEFKPGVKASHEYCVRTSDIFVEAKLSECSVCCVDDC